ncbi:hypothetical protein Sjap_009867 [Stephania japonica]|uniref:Uncharacterized protein n=1 Tax=Stephania japonica TaxID=461633 RepID=A0AAP0J9C5_9MAGN
MQNSSKCKPPPPPPSTTSSASSSSDDVQSKLVAVPMKARHDDPRVDKNLEVTKRKIVFSDVGVKRRNRAYWLRKWRLWDLTISIGLMVHVHFMCFLYAWSTFSWSRFFVGLCIGIITGMFGISISYHRNLAHRAFNLPKWLEYLFAYCGILSFQRGGVNNVRDLEKQFYYRFLQATNYIHPFLPAIPLLWWGGFPLLVWGLVGCIDNIRRRLA